jgi:hypothetical protein
MSRLTVGSIEGLTENSNVISVPTGHSLNVVDGIQVDGQYMTPYAGRRNLLYNGAMQVAQRGTSTPTSSGGYFTADRWKTENTSLGGWTQSVENDAPTGSGFRQSLKMLCTTADASPAANDYLALRQSLEGQDVQQIKKGTSAAEQLTLSFWVKSNVTGTYVTRLKDEDNARNCSASYTISASATWEKKTIAFPADTTGVLDNDNAASLFVEFLLAGASAYNNDPLQTTWGAEGTAANIAAGQTNLASAVNNYWQITGVQLELGDKATPFEHRSYGEELALCQRYYQRITAGGTYGRVAIGQAYTTGAVMAMMPLRVSLRTVPTAIDAASLLIVDGASGGFVIYVISLDTAGSNEDVVAVIATTAGLTTYRPYQISGSNNANGYLGVSAEL